MLVLNGKYTSTLCLCAMSHKLGLVEGGSMIYHLTGLCEVCVVFPVKFIV